MNINNQVRVKLTPYAIELMRENHFNLFNGAKYAPPFVVPRTDKEGYTKFQLLDLMHEFGQAMYMGNSNQCFENNEIVLE